MKYYFRERKTQKKTKTIKNQKKNFIQKHCLYIIYFH